MDCKYRTYKRNKIIYGNIKYALYTWGSNYLDLLRKIEAYTSFLLVNRLHMVPFISSCQVND